MSWLISIASQVGQHSGAMFRNAVRRFAPILAATVTVNHVERYHRELKRHIPSDLNVGDYEDDPELWLMNAAWRCRISGDPFVKLGDLVHGDAADEQDEAEYEGEEEDASDVSSAEEDDSDAEE